MNNPGFKPVEFDWFKNEAGANAFTMSPKKWIEATNAVGIVSKSGRYGGSFAHLFFPAKLYVNHKLSVMQKRLSRREFVLLLKAFLIFIMLFCISSAIYVTILS